VSEYDSIATIQQRHAWLDSQVIKGGPEREYLRDVGTLLTEIAALRGALAPLVEGERAALCHFWDDDNTWDECAYCHEKYADGQHAPDCPIPLARALLAETPKEKGGE
jgi:hypothetical protein